MQIRNPIWSGKDMINVEMDHPVYGWIPCTLSPDDRNTSALYAIAMDGDIAPYLDVSEVSHAELVPEFVSVWQIKTQILRDGLLDDADLAIENSEDREVIIAWNGAQTLLRSGQTIALISESLSLSNQEMDNIFIQASKIEA